MNRAFLLGRALLARRPASRQTSPRVQACVAKKIPTLRHEGMPQRQAIAVAFAMCRRKAGLGRGPASVGLDAQAVARTLLLYARGSVTESLALDVRRDAMMIRCHLIEALAYLRIPFLLPGLADAFARAEILGDYRQLFQELTSAERHAFDSPGVARDNRHAFLDGTSTLLSRMAPARRRA